MYLRDKYEFVERIKMSGRVEGERERERDNGVVVN